MARLDGGAADEAIDTTIIALDLAERPHHHLAVRDIKQFAGDALVAAFGLVHRGIVDVADHDARPGPGRGTGERAADAVAAAGDDDHISIRLKAGFHFPIRRSAVRQYGDG